MNTGDMYSGMTSGSFGSNKAVKKQRKDIKELTDGVKQAILPAYQQVISDIDIEIDRHYKLAINLAKVYQTEDEARFRMAALSMYIDYLSSLKTKYQSTAKGVIHEG